MRHGGEGFVTNSESRGIERPERAATASSGPMRFLRVRHSVTRKVTASSEDVTPAANAGRNLPLLLIGERGQRLYPLNPVDIDYVESAGNYVKYMCGGAEFIARELMKELESRLQPFGFIRIERSLLLNVWAIEYVEPAGRAAFVFTLQSGVRLHSGANYRTTILQVLPLRRRSASQAAAKLPATQGPTGPRDARRGWSSVASSEEPQ
jgi:DNA-binding LytR/AlgR family response regulator